MSSVPTQGVVVDPTAPKKRNDRGILGEGTRSLQMKRMWKLDQKMGTRRMPLKVFARLLAGKLTMKQVLEAVVDPRDEEPPPAIAVRWLHGKAHPPKKVFKPRIHKDAKASGAINVPKKARG